MDEINKLKKITYLSKSDPEAALRELAVLADEGSASAQELLGNFYRNKDKKIALHYYRQAANNGRDSAQEAVFSILSDDPNYIVDENSEAFVNLKKAAEQGYEPAVAFLASFYGGVNVGNSVSATINISPNLDECLRLIKKLDGKTDHQEIQNLLDLVKKEIKNKYPSSYSNYFLDSNMYCDSSYTSIPDNVNNVSSVSKGKSGGKFGVSSVVIGVISLFLGGLIAIIVNVIGVILAIISKKQGNASSAMIGLLINAILLILQIISIFNFIYL